MSERKVLNKYYPPDFDPAKIPRMKLPKNRQYTVRLMAPFNMRCKTCGEYIYRGKKFNARKEDVEGEDYCGIRIYRFYIKCTRCLQEISFKTDPKNTDYEIEAGATRNFMALKLAQEQEKREEDELKEEEANNPMKLLENRTEQSKLELELLESLEELRDLNRRHYNIDFDSLLKKYNTTEVQEKLLELQKEKDEEIIKSLLKQKPKNLAVGGKNEILEYLSNDSDTSTTHVPPVKMKFLETVETVKSEPGISQTFPVFVNSEITKSQLYPVLVKNEPGTSQSFSTLQRENETLNTVHTASGNVSKNKSLKNLLSSMIQKKQNKPSTSALSLISSYSGSDNDSS